MLNLVLRTERRIKGTPDYKWTLIIYTTLQQQAPQLQYIIDTYRTKYPVEAMESIYISIQIGFIVVKVYCTEHLQGHNAGD